MTDRRYNEDEVAAIFRVATEGSDSRGLPGERSGGLTLADLRDIAREVGVSADAVSRAAQSLDSGDLTQARTYLGLPVVVGRTVNLARNLTDSEWELLVVQLRRVFRARGTVRVQGSLRQWSNGNLHALLEPTPAGYQLRLGTSKDGAVRTSVTIGAIATAMSGLVALVGAVHGTFLQALPGAAALLAGGGFFIGNSVLRVPRWASLRLRQMDDVAEWLPQITQDTDRHAIE